MNKNNCIDRACKYCNTEMKHFNLYCTKLNIIVPDDIDITGCKHFELARTCLNCKHSWEYVYETGTIDDIEYRCELQDINPNGGNKFINKKFIYDDSNPYNRHYSDIPECMIDKFEEINI